MRKYLISFLLTMLVFSGYGQALKTYSGNYTLRGEENTRGKLTYDYYENNNKQIYNGRFNFTGNIYSDWNEPIASVKINGRMKNNLRTGIWTASVYSKNGQQSLSENFNFNYTKGKLNGKNRYKYIEKNGNFTKVYTLDATFTNNKFRYFSASTYLNGILIEETRGSFDEQGFLNGKWIIKYRAHSNARTLNDLKKIPLIQATRLYRHGLCYQDLVKVVQTGEVVSNYDNTEFINAFFENYKKADNISSIRGKFYSIKDVDDLNIYFGHEESSRRQSILFWFNYDEKGNLLNNNNIPGLVEENITVEKNIIGVDAQYLAEMANEEAGNGDFKAALKYARQAADIDNNLEYQNYVAMYLIFNQKYADAVKLTESCLNKCGNCDVKNDILRNRFHALLLSGKFNKAFELFDKNSSIKIYDRPWINAIYKDFDRLKSDGIYSPDFDKFKKEVNKKLKEFIEQGDKYYIKGKWQDAVKKYMKALDYNPDNKHVANRINRMNDLYDNIDVYYKKGVNFMEKGENDSALLYLRAILNFYPYEARGNYRFEPKQKAIYSVTDYPEKIELINNVGWLLLLDKDYNSALRILQHGLEIIRTKDYMYGYVLLNLAHAYLFTGDIEKAKEIYYNNTNLVINKMRWADATVNDFNLFIDYGIESPYYYEIAKKLKRKKMLKISGK